MSLDESMERLAPRKTVLCFVCLNDTELLFHYEA